MLETFLGIGIVGVAISLLIQFIKNKLGTDTMATKAMTVIIALLAGTTYYFLSTTGYWPSVLGILTTASTFYAFFLKK